jgi:AcrR family transcriptional regulator
MSAGFAGRKRGERHTARGARAAERRDAILDAALNEFSARGFTATRLDDVAEHAGVAKGTIYLETPRQSRHDRLAELIKRARGTIDSGITDLASNPEHLKTFGRKASGHR